MRRAAVANKGQSSKALKVVKELDAFPKVPENFKETTASGGGISILTFAIIVILVISEVRYYTDTYLKFDYVVDAEVDGKIKINIDMTVAMRCELIGADVLDQTGQDTQSHGTLAMDNAHYELSPRQKHYRDITQHINRYMREEYHAIQELMWLSGTHPGMKAGMPEREDNPSGPFDACRVHGTLEVNKVAGNFHITAGKSVPVIPRGHAHLAIMLSPKDYNFSHRIDHFSFGEMSAGIVNPLDGEEQVTKENYQLFQYFMKIVPTDVKTYTNQLNTYQYSVTERNRTINHSGGSHGMPGIFVKYDVFPFKIQIMEEHKPYSQFLIRLCGIIGGIFVVSGILHSGVGFLVDILCCRFKIGRYGNQNKTEQLLYPGSETLSTNQNSFTQNSHGAFDPVDLLQDGTQSPAVGLLSSAHENLAETSYNSYR